jgi:hypothetical protein
MTHYPTSHAVKHFYKGVPWFSQERILVFEQRKKIYKKKEITYDYFSEDAFTASDHKELRTGVAS